MTRPGFDRACIRLLIQPRRALAWILVLACLTVLAFQGSRGLYETTEGRYAECARQMLLSGQWGEPMLNGEHHWTKPPLTYWAIGLGLKLFGVNTWGARAYLVPVFVLTVAAVYGAGAALWRSRRAGVLAALVYASSPFTLAASHTVSTDALLTLWEACTICGFWTGVRTRDARLFVLMWLALGLAMLTKGPPGLLPLLGILPVYYLRRREARLPGLFPAVGLLLFAIVGCGWYALEAIRFPGLLRYWLLEETVARNFSEEFRRNPGWTRGFVIYLPILVLGAAPWLAVVLALRRRLRWPRGRAWLKPLGWTRGVEWLYLGLAVILPLALFMMSRSKLALYVLPLFIPISLALGKLLSDLARRKAVHPRALAALAGICCLLLIAVKAALPLHETKKDMRRLETTVGQALAQHPAEPLYLFDTDELLGLQFYLQRELPHLDDDLHEAITRPGAHGLILTRTRTLRTKPLKGLLKSGRIEQVSAGEDYSVLYFEGE